MRKRLWVSIFVWASLLSCGVAWADFYVISGGKISGTRITSLPYTITSSGFYYLAEDLTSANTGISVNADHVTIDLMGFSLIGPGKGSGSNYGVYIIGRTNVEIRNGTIRNFGSDGIYASAGKSDRILNVRVIGNGGDGMSLNGYAHVVRNCTASENTDIGIFPGNGGLVIGNSVYNNGSHGIYIVRSLVTNNYVYANGGLNIAPITGDLVAIENYAP